MLEKGKKEISKNMYMRIKEKGGIYVNREILPDIFTDSMLYGYGIYSPIAIEKDGKYYVEYKIGSTCD